MNGSKISAEPKIGVLPLEAYAICTLSNPSLNKAACYVFVETFAKKTTRYKTPISVTHERCLLTPMYTAQHRPYLFRPCFDLISKGHDFRLLLPSFLHVILSTQIKNSIVKSQNPNWLWPPLRAFAYFWPTCHGFNHRPWEATLFLFVPRGSSSHPTHLLGFPSLGIQSLMFSRC